eukprot:1545699-Rhodomonas_salina.1
MHNFPGHTYWQLQCVSVPSCPGRNACAVFVAANEKLRVLLCCQCCQNGPDGLASPAATLLLQSCSGH